MGCQCELAVLTIRVLAQKIQFNTYGGIPLCSGGGLAVVDEKRQTQCTDAGSHLHARLRDLQQRYEIIGDVRSRGLMVGVELVTDRIGMRNSESWEFSLGKEDCMATFLK